MKFGRVKFFKSLHYAEFQSLLQEMPHKKGRPGGKKLVINQVVKDEPEKVSPMERDAPAGGRVEGWVVCGENPQGDEVQKLLALVEGTGLAQVATRILDVLAGQIAKSYGARSEPSGRDKLNEDFYNVKDALVEQTKAEQKFMEARQKILEAEQHLKAVVEKYLSKNI